MTLVSKTQRAGQWLGLDVSLVLRSLRGVPVYRRNRKKFLEQATGREDFAIGRAFPCLGDRYESSGDASGQYFNQDLYVAQLIAKAAPKKHVDVGSRVDGFVAHVATFMPVEVLDIRPLVTTAVNIEFRQRDIMSADPSFDAYTPSLSCLHCVEHFGLGRYGDDINYDGYLKGWENLVRMVEPGGVFYFSVPIGENQRIEFDAHRVFSLPFLLKELILPSFDVAKFAYVDEAGNLVTDVAVDSPEAQSTFGLTYGCGIFVLTRKAG